MAFEGHEVEMDESFSPESDPAISNLMKREAGASVLQDIQLNTYYANTAGKTKYPGVYQLYMRELKNNLSSMMCEHINYQQLEDFLTVLGYEAGDIRLAFTECTGIDPTKLEFMRQEDVNNTPANIPWYNLGWGYAKGKNKGTYFIMPFRGNLYSAFLQKDDMTREEVGNFLTEEEARTYVKALVPRLHVYDLPVMDRVMEAIEPVKDESTKKEYMVMANYLYELSKRGELDMEKTARAIEHSVQSGVLTQDEGESLFRMYVESDDKPDPKSPTDTSWADETKTQKYYQDSVDVKEKAETSTPQEFFEDTIPDETEQIASNHIKEVLGYISRRQSDMDEFEVKLHSLDYLRHDYIKSLVDINPESGRPTSPPRATISVVLEIRDRTLPEDKNRKFALAVFFISPDGQLSTSDSIKGEDDVIYGFSEDGVNQYFTKDRMSAGQGA